MHTTRNALVVLAQHQHDDLALPILALAAPVPEPGADGQACQSLDRAPHPYSH